MATNNINVADNKKVARRHITAWILGLVLVGHSLACVSQAQVWHDGPVSVSVTNCQGWVVVTGHANGRIIWQHPVTRFNRQGISLDQGEATAFLAVGSQMFQIDKNSGDTLEIGQRPFFVPPCQRVGGQPPNVSQVQSPPTPVACSPKTPATQPAAIKLLPSLPDPLANLTASERATLMADRNLLMKLDQARNHLEAATAFLAQVHQNGPAGADRLVQAEAAVAAARVKLEAAVKEAVQQLKVAAGTPATHLAPAASLARPATQPEAVAASIN